MAEFPIVDLSSDPCPHCKGMIPAGAAKCQHCGEWLRTQPHSKPAWVSFWIIIAISIALVFVVYGSMKG